MGREGERHSLKHFSHTSNSTYLTALFALCCVGYDSTHDVIERSHINKKWFYLFGATCLFAYLYVRPLIRRRLGSASSGYINYSTCYISWLIISVFYHLPSLESMGINIKADVGMWLACFLGSLCTLGALHAAYGLAVAVRAADHRLYSPTASSREVWGIVVMNSVNLAVACSVYYSFCGNAPSGSLAGYGWNMKEAVCHKWLHPLSASSHTAFTRWVIYGEAANSNGSAGNVSSSSSGIGSSTGFGSGAVAAAPAAAPAAPVAGGGGPAAWLLRGTPGNASGGSGSGYVEIDIPLDGKGMLPVPATDLVSPIFTLWLTLLLMYAANCLADYAAAATLNAAYTADMRRVLASRQRSLRRHQRRRSADFAHDLRSAASWASHLGGSAHSLLHGGDSGDHGGTSGSGGAVRDALSSLAARGSFDTLLRTMSSVGHLLGSPSSTMRRAGSMFFRDDGGVGLATGWLHQGPGGSTHGEAGDTNPGGSGSSSANEACVPLPADAAQPSFLPMFPWYSGTSADLIKTLFDLLISVRVFLGRFDMRTLQAAIAPRPTGPDAPAVGGDGFTFEHLSGREEVWWDFVADTGDGGDPTYAIARCMAAQQVHITVPAEVAAAGAAGCGPEAKAAASLAAGQRTLPRADMVCHGGDLCYPSPSDETFEQRLFGPYQDAFPPPGRVHPGHLVVNKPDLGPEHWAAAAAAVTAGGECRCGSGNSGLCASHRAGGNEAVAKPCRLCAKEAALRSYDGPTLFAIPGNHDWLDGLDAFQSHIQHRGWLGGWLMPQEKSYWAVALPHGWWLFGLDLALEDDIDMCQYSYFARIAEERVGPNDQVILMQHCPSWLVDWFWGKSGANNLRQLIRGPLKGRARLQLAGDLHFTMRHSFRQYGPGQSPSLAPSQLPTPAGGSPLGGSPLGGSPTASRMSSRAATPAPGLHRHLSPSQLHQSLVNRLAAGGGGGSGNFGSSSFGGAANGTSTAAAAMAATASTGALRPADLPLSPPVLKHTRSSSSIAGGGGGGLLAPGGASPQPSSPLAGTNGNLDLANWAALDSASSPPANSQTPLMAAAPADSPASQLSTPAISSASTATAAATPPLTIGGQLAGSQAALPPLSMPRSSSQRRQLDAQQQQQQQGMVSGAAGGMLGALGSLGASPPSGGASPFHAWWPGLRSHTNDGSGGGSANGGNSYNNNSYTANDASTAFQLHSARRGSSEAGGGSGASLSHDAVGSAASASGNGGPISSTGPGPGWQLSDPEHLIVCGAGGGFCHPTHVFTEARFRPEHHPAAGPIYTRTPSTLQQQQLAQQQAAQGCGPAGQQQQAGPQQAASSLPHLRSSFPSSSSLYSLGLRGSEADQRRPAGGEYRCEAAFPPPPASRRLGRANLTFRSVNNRFDVVGGLLYYLLVISVLPRCSGVAEVLEASTLGQAASAFLSCGLAAASTILTESHVSLAALVLVLLILFGLCRSGGIGALPGVPPMLRRRPELHGSPLAVRARLGGVPTQLLYASAHCLAHLAAAISLLLLLELAIEVMIKYEGVGRDGYHSLYKWYRGFEALHFPDPMGVRDLLHKYSLGLYPTVLKWAMAVFDVPESIAVSRTAMCTGGGLAAVTRLQAAGYYLGVLAYYWLLATPTVGFLFGAYLYISVNWFHVHYDEAFSSLQVPHFKGFLRFHITRAGDLEMFGLGLEKSPHAWREDPRWRSQQGGGNRDLPAHRATFPSRWVPVEERVHLLRPPRMVPPPEAQLKLVDYLLVPRHPRKG